MSRVIGSLSQQLAPATNLILPLSGQVVAFVKIGCHVERYEAMAFCELAGYELDDQFKTGMQIRMALHRLNILLPRKNSFDQFDPAAFAHRIENFIAIADGQENPQGYD